MKTIKQPPGSAICVLACIAMLTDKTLDEIVAMARLTRCDRTGKDYCAKREELRLFAELGFITGMSPHWTAPVKLYEDDLTEVSTWINIADAPAMLTVHDERYISGVHDISGVHAVVWDNVERCVRDPLFDVAETTPLHFYRVQEWEIVRPIIELPALEKI
jgi:hypothetical protein